MLSISDGEQEEDILVKGENAANSRISFSHNDFHLMIKLWLFLPLLNLSFAESSNSEFQKSKIGLSWQKSTHCQDNTNLYTLA